MKLLHFGVILLKTHWPEITKQDKLSQVLVELYRSVQTCYIIFYGVKALASATGTGRIKKYRHRGVKLLDLFVILFSNFYPNTSSIAPQMDRKAKLALRVPLCRKLLDRWALANLLNYSYLP